MTEIRDNPAKFSEPILDVIERLVDGWADEPVRRLLDPFAGTGKIHRFDSDQVQTVGVEIEPEWAGHDPRTLVGDALRLPFRTDAFDVVATSPVYGNRMSDHHENKDSCKTCAGTGVEGDPDGYEPRRVCRTCRGEKLSRRYTYRHFLGRLPHRRSSSTLGFGDEYKTFHRVAIDEVRRVLRSGGLLVWNVSNFPAAGNVVEIVEWYVRLFLDLGFGLHAAVPVRTSRSRHGANRDRVDFEHVLAFIAPSKERKLSL